jgi:hypothetical protein
VRRMATRRVTPVRRRRARHRLIPVLAVLALAGVLSGAGIPPRPTSDTVKLTVPALVAKSYPFGVTAHGVSHGLSQLTVFLKNAACPPSAKLATSPGAHKIINTDVSGSYSTRHTVKAAKFVGMHIACAYLTSVGTPTAVTKATAQAPYSTVAFPKVTSPLFFTFTFGSFTKVVELTISGVPSGGAVTVNCSGSGCPFGSRSFSHKGRVALAGSFAGAHLSPHATIRILITAPNEVGKVAIFTVRRGALPSLSQLCLPPGAPKPLACAV